MLFEMVAVKQKSNSFIMTEVMTLKEEGDSMVLTDSNKKSNTYLLSEDTTVLIKIGGVIHNFQGICINIECLMNLLWNDEVEDHIDHPARKKKNKEKKN